MKLEKQTVIRIGLAAGALILFNWLLHNIPAIGSVLGFIWSASFPFILGFVIAFLFNLPMSAIERKFMKKWSLKSKRPVSFFITLVLFVLFFGIFVLVLIPQLWNTTVQLVSSMPSYISRLSNNLKPLLAYQPDVEKLLANLSIDWSGVISWVVNILKNGAGNAFMSSIWVASSIAGGFFVFMIATIVACYMLFDKEHLSAQFKGLLKAYMPEKRYGQTVDLGQLLYTNYANFVSGQCLEALLLMTIYFIIFLVGGFYYPLLLSVIIGFTTLIPLIGAWIGGIICSFILLVSMGPSYTIAFLIILVVMVQIDANFIYPHVVGHSVGLSPIWVLVSVMFGAAVAGIVGMLLFIPLFSVAYTLVRRHATQRLTTRGLTNPVDELPKPAPKKKKKSK